MFFIFFISILPWTCGAQQVNTGARAVLWDEYAKSSITKDLKTLNQNNYFTKNIKRTLERPKDEDQINPRKIKRLEHELSHNGVLKAYIQNLLKSFIKERRRLVQENEPPQPDIPIELGVTKQENVDQLPTTQDRNEQCEGNLCSEIDNDKNLPSDVHSGVYHEEEYSASSDKETEDTHDVFNGESDDMFPPKVPEIPIELGSAFQQNDDGKNAEVECKKKPCQQPCTGNTDCPPNEAPPEPDIPIELGSARSELSTDSFNGEDELTYIPQKNLPKKFLLVENSKKAEKYSIYSSGNGERTEDLEPAQKRSLPLMASGDHNATTNNDGDFDGELLVDDSNEQSMETANDKEAYLTVRSPRKRRGLPVKAKTIKLSSVSKTPNLSNRKTSKRSDIDEDKELLQTIESIDTEMASKRGISQNDKPLQGYMRKLAHDVRSVMGEARTVLRNTGKVVHGLKRVINGATVLTSFTNNAVKFAKYFSMEPDNATIDYLEEKAIVAVLEAQKAANEARDAANLAKIASTKARAAERRMEVARKQHKSLQKILPYIRTATHQAERAERASLYASKNKQKTETDVMLMDKELKKMGAQLKKQNELNTEPTESSKTDSSFESSANQPEGKSKEATETGSAFETSKSKAKNYDEDYFYKKQKQLEEELKGKTKSMSSIQTLQNFAGTNNRKATPSQSGLTFNEDEKNKTFYSNTTIASNAPQSTAVLKSNEGPKLEGFSKDNSKTQETPKLSEQQDSAELQYIASLNKRIASIKKEEEEAKERLKAAELARNFVASTTNKMLKVQEPVAYRIYDGTNNIARSNAVPNPVSVSKPFQPVLNEEIPKTIKISAMRTAIPVKKSKQTKHTLHSREKTISRKFQKPTTVETPEYNVPSVVKKELVKSTDRPNESTGFRKQEIIGSKLRSILKKQHFSKEVSDLKSANELERIASAFSSADNNVVSEDFNPAEKRERVLYESKLLSEKLRKMNSALRGLKFNLPDSDKSKRHFKKSGFAQTVNRGPITVTVAVHSSRPSNLTLNENTDKNVDFVDPFGFKNLEETNEGPISDRNKIPRPSDYYKVEYQRSIIPRPDTVTSQYKKERLVIDEKK